VPYRPHVYVRLGALKSLLRHFVFLSLRYEDA
jgi:hypothetical protein